MDTMLLNRSDIAKLIDIDLLLDDMKAAFVAYSSQRQVEGKRFFSPLPGPGDMMLLAPGLCTGIPAYSVKVHAKFPDEDPGIRGVLLLHDLQDGSLLAAMDSTHLTAVRTGLSAAIATHTLARPEAGSVAVIGAGVQGKAQLRYLSALRAIGNVSVFDTNPEQADRYVQEMSAELDMNMVAADSLQAATAHADILLCATWSQQPVILSSMVSPGTHVTTLGADQPAEAEIDEKLIKRGLFVCDDRNLAMTMGAIGGVGLQCSDIHAELGEVLSGSVAGRTTAEQVTLYGAVGVPFQDLVIAWHVYSIAQQDGNKTQRFNFYQ